MADKIRLGFIGAGGMGQAAHIHNYAQLTDMCELVALAEIRPKLARRVADRYGIAEVYPDHTALLESADVDAVVAIMGYALHHNVVPDILNAGTHLLTEKPIGCRADAAESWAKLARDKGLVYLVGYMKRWDLGVRYVVDLITRWRASGEYGKLTYLRCNMSGTDWTWNPEDPLFTDEGFDKPLAAEPFPEKFDEEQAQLYNTQINFYVHQVNLIRFLVGEDYVLDFNHPSGKTFTATTESGTPIVLEMGIYELNQSWDEIYHICFEGADIELRLPAPLHKQQNGEVRVRRNTGETREELCPNIIPPSWSFFEQAKGFLECVQSGRAPHDSAGDAVKDLRIFERQVELSS